MASLVLLKPNNFGSTSIANPTTAFLLVPFKSQNLETYNNFFFLLLATKDYILVDFIV